MASITRRDGKKSVSYQLTAVIGTNADGTPIRRYKTWHPPGKMSEARMEKAAMLAAEEFERTLREGYRLDEKCTFAEFAAYAISEMRREGVKPRTTDRYEELLVRANAAIGHMRLGSIHPQHLNAFYRNLSEPGIRHSQEKAVARIDVKAWLNEHNMSRAEIARRSGVAAVTVGVAVRGEKILAEKAAAIAAAMGMQTEDVFDIEHDTSPLNPKTILEHHRVISVVLGRAEKEMLVPYNAAAKATPPRVIRKEVRILEPDEVEKMLLALEKEPLRWRVATELMMATMGRRGEAAAIGWSKINFEEKTVRIDRQLIRVKGRGIVELPTKTNDVRILELPDETIELLKEYRKEQEELKKIYGNLWVETGYVLTKENGERINPESLTAWLNDFSNRHGLPHIHPHMLRHTGASYCIENGIDLATVSENLGHANIATTQGTYVHAVKAARAKTTGCISSMMYGHRRKQEEVAKDTAQDQEESS